MNTRSLLFGSLVIGAVLQLYLRRAAKPAPATPASGAALYDAIDAYIEGEMSRLNIPGVSLAIVQGEQIVHLRGFGRARPRGQAPSPQTPFPIGSLTKSFTALAVMQLVEVGKIELDAPVQHYLPWFRVADPQASAQMRVRHLLNQTSGLPTSSGEIQLADFDNRPRATERQARALSTLVLTRPVGSAFEYSNSNYSLLGLIIEAASGESYADYIQEHIFTPLEMDHTYASQDVAKQNGLAMGHQYRFAVPFAAPNLLLPLGSLPAGTLISSSVDMARYLIAHLNGGRYEDVQIVSSAGIDELHRGAINFNIYGLSLGYGMGWFVDKIGQTQLIWHSGTLPNFGAYMALLPKQKYGIVLLFNACHHWFNPVLTGVGMGVTALLAGEQVAPVPMVGMIPWMLRGQLLIPAFQIADVVAMLWLLRRRRLEPARRPSSDRAWELYAFLPLIPNVLAALTLIPLLGKRRGYLKLYMSDFSWIAMVCGSFAFVWIFLRTGLVFRALRKR